MQTFRRNLLPLSQDGGNWSLRKLVAYLPGYKAPHIPTEEGQIKTKI
jgi:hypothetical protein